MNLVIGIGSSLRSDDGLGLYLAENVRHRGAVITCTQLMPELAEPISQAERVIFFDAHDGSIPTEITCERVEPMITVGAFSHHVTPSSLLAAAQTWYGRTPDALLIAVTGGSFELGTAFSPTIQVALPNLTRTIERIALAFFEADSAGEDG